MYTTITRALEVSRIRKWFKVASESTGCSINVIKENKKKGMKDDKHSNRIMKGKVYRIASKRRED